ncbi:hypothetical protein OIU77_025232 [Salix suchowensis]|uniref:Phosphoglycerate dehydrogenase n=1 Tax=Salix suchowensis TaxID=1278906 RepID=A0ABQ9BZJ6_9ROSI|nr:hypothetical protein OIU77_025232 [Salix suchowensis]
MAATSSLNLVFAPTKPTPFSGKLSFPSPFTAANFTRRQNRKANRFVVFATTFSNVDCSHNLSPEELCTKISLCDALIVRCGTKVTREVFERSGGRLKVGGRAGVGVDNVDLSAATEHGCLVVNAPTANTIAAAEHGIDLPTAMARNIAQADVSMKAGKWQRSKYVGVSLVGKTLAVMGFGKVGSEVARRAKGLGMHVIAHDPYAPADRARAIGAFSQMKKGVRIVNVALGGVIDEEALVRALDSGIVCSGSCFLHHVLIALILAEAVVGALKGELAATAVNTPMVPAEVRKTWQTGSATGWRWRWCTVNKDDLCFCQRSR